MIIAIILGFLGVITISSVAYFNDYVLRQTQLIGDHMPISIFGGLFIFLMLVNPLLARFKKGYALSGKQIAIALSLILVACTIPSGGLMRDFPSILILPHYYGNTLPGAKEAEAIKEIYPNMLVDIDQGGKKVLDGYVHGMGNGDKHISLNDIPWRAWKRPLMFWIPFLFVLWIGLIGLSLVVHKQWSDHEQLTYPVSMLATSVLPSKDGKSNGVFRNKLFWMALFSVFGIHLINYIHTWFPNFISIPFVFDLSSLVGLSSVFESGGGRHILFRTTMYFSAIGISYFISNDVSFSIGIGSFVRFYIWGALATYGIYLWEGTYGYGHSFYPSPDSFFKIGTALGIVLFLIYNGRNYYGKVVSRMFFIGKKDDSGEDVAVWGARVFLLSMLVLFVNIVFSGVSWYLAIATLFFIVVIYVVQARVITETGLYFYHPAAPVVILALFGLNVIGIKSLVFVTMIMAVLQLSGASREALMPYVLTAFKILDVNKIKYGRMSALFVMSLIIALVVALPVTLYFQYDRGSSVVWTTGREIPTSVISNIVDVKDRLESQGNASVAGTYTGMDVLSHITPDNKTLVGLVAGLVLTILFTIARYRFNWWPLHPVMFLTWGEWASIRLGPSFLIGSLIKKLVVTYGGERVYQKLKPLMIGVIAGDMLGGVVFAIVGMLYYYFTGEIPKPFTVTAG